MKTAWVVTVYDDERGGRIVGVFIREPTEEGINKLAPLEDDKWKALPSNQCIYYKECTESELDDTVEIDEYELFE